MGDEFREPLKNVIARSAATKQSRKLIGIAKFLDCFASLAMTERGFLEMPFMVNMSHFTADERCSSVKIHEVTIPNANWH